MPDTLDKKGDVLEPKVHEDVLAEIKTLNENTKAQHTELQKSYKQLKETLESGIEGNRVATPYYLMNVSINVIV